MTGDDVEVALLSVDGLSVSFHGLDSVARAVVDVDFDIEPGETVALVGESGCGKSATALAVLGLLPPRSSEVAARRVDFSGEDLLGAPERELRRVRGDRIGMVFQEPMTSLNPVYRVGEQVAEVVRAHRRTGRREAWQLAVEALRDVGIPDPADRARSYPHELSGGMRQRAMIAMAIVCRPELLIADEPTTALDVTVQAAILDLLQRLQDDLGMAILLITHDMGVVAEMARRVLVMYAGRIVESAGVADLFGDPQHPYTRALLEAIPRVEGAETSMKPIPGTVPDAGRMPPGCAFAERCSIVEDRCRGAVPDVVGLAVPEGDSRAAPPRHEVRCFAIGSGPEYSDNGDALAPIGERPEASR